MNEHEIVGPNSLGCGLQLSFIKVHIIVANVLTHYIALLDGPLIEEFRLAAQQFNWLRHQVCERVAVVGEAAVDDVH